MGSIGEPVAGDARYLENDMYNFPICILCAHWNPFLVWLDTNPQATKYRESFDIQLYCPQCAPRPGHFAQIFPGEKLFREDSILNDKHLMDLLGTFNYKHPLDNRFFELDRIIITENAKLRQPYKVLGKKAVPLSRKLRQLMELFPVMHRMTNEKFRSFRAMCAAVRRTASEIADGYMNLSESEHSQLQDNFDVLVDRTPMHVRMSSQQQQRLQMPHPPPITPGPPAAAEDTLSSLGDISVVSSTTVIDGMRTQATSGDSDIDLSSQDVGQNRGGIVLSSQSQEQPAANVSVAQSSSTSDLQLSSQEVSVPAIPLSSQDVRVSQGVARSESSLSNSSSSSSLESNSSASRNRRKRSFNQDGPPNPNDGQVAGPSRKRPRNDLVMNPTPAQFLKDPSNPRLPRFSGA